MTQKTLTENELKKIVENLPKPLLDYLKKNLEKSNGKLSNRVRFV